MAGQRACPSKDHGQRPGPSGTVSRFRTCLRHRQARTFERRGGRGIRATGSGKLQDQASRLPSGASARCRRAATFPPKPARNAWLDCAHRAIRTCFAIIRRAGAPTVLPDVTAGEIGQDGDHGTDEIRENGYDLAVHTTLHKAGLPTHLRLTPSSSCCDDTRGELSARKGNERALERPFAGGESRATGSRDHISSERGKVCASHAAKASAVSRASPTAPKVRYSSLALR